jgi:glutamine amidotransferase
MTDQNPAIIINYGMGNVASVLSMSRFIGGDARISTSPDEVRDASTLILPGVGAFNAGIRSLRETGMDSAR